jgi:DNA integrity scanning protein DisA with diadenylate cyclase activity
MISFIPSSKMVKKKSSSAQKPLKYQKIEKKIIGVAIELAKKGEGALFVIGDNIGYDRLLNQEFKPFSVFSNGADKVLKGLAVIDGAVIINKQGFVIDYGAMINKTKAFVGYGTRHSAGLTASKGGNVSILCSEEEKKVKIFRDGKYIMQVDALERGIEKDTTKIATALESIGAGLIGTVGAATIVPTLGISLLPGVIIFGGSYYTIKKILNKLRF